MSPSSRSLEYHRFGAKRGPKQLIRGLDSQLIEAPWVMDGIENRILLEMTCVLFFSGKILSLQANFNESSI